MIDRRTAFESLVHLNRPFPEIEKEISHFKSNAPFDYLEPPVVLTRQQVINALEKYISHELSTQELYDWETFVMYRDDVIKEPGYGDTIRDVLEDFEEFLDYDKKITHQDVEDWIQRIKNAPFDPTDVD